MNVGITTFVHGWYVDYIPIFCMAAEKAYPEYGIKIFVKEPLPKRIQSQLSDKCSIQEIFQDKHKDNKDPSKKPYYLRWFLPPEYLSEFDSVFVCDIDLLMLREDPMMHVQREAICDKSRLPFANFLRDDTPGYPNRITGWHYLRVKPYYEKMQPVIDSVLNDPDFDISNPPSYCYHNGLGEKQWGQESILYQMLNLSFGDLEHIREKEFGFPTHHGIHMGPFRGDIPSLVNSRSSRGLNHVARNMKYWNMIESVLTLMSDEKFQKLKNKIEHPNVKFVINRVCSHFRSKLMI